MRRVAVRSIVTPRSTIAVRRVIAAWPIIFRARVPRTRRLLMTLVGCAIATHFFPWRGAFIATNWGLRARDRPSRGMRIRISGGARRHHVRSVEFPRTRRGCNRRPPVILRSEERAVARGQMLVVVLPLGHFEMMFPFRPLLVVRRTRPDSTTSAVVAD